MQQVQCSASRSVNKVGCSYCSGPEALAMSYCYKPPQITEPVGRLLASYFV